MMRFLILIFGFFGGMASAEEPRVFGLSVSAELEATGLMAYLLPRFALKSGRRAEPVGQGGDVAIVAGGG